MAAAVRRAISILGDSLLGVVVFGSVARGDHRNASDVDILAVADHRVPINRGLYRRWDGEPELRWDGHRVEPHFVQLPAAAATPSGLWAELALDGLVLFERGLAVSSWLTAVRRQIAEGRFRRRVTHGQPYWIQDAPMTNSALAEDYVRRAKTRLATLDLLRDAESWPDVVREAQEVVGLALKALLRSCGVSPPRVHDVSRSILEAREALPIELRDEAEWLALASRKLRRDRELAFYGAEDLTPSEFYTLGDADEARDDARRVVELVFPHVAGG